MAATPKKATPAAPAEERTPTRISLAVLIASARLWRIVCIVQPECRSAPPKPAALSGPCRVGVRGKWQTLVYAMRSQRRKHGPVAPRLFSTSSRGGACRGGCGHRLRSRSTCWCGVRGLAVVLCACTIGALATAVDEGSVVVRQTSVTAPIRLGKPKASRLLMARASHPSRNQLDLQYRGKVVLRRRKGLGAGL